MKDQTLVLLYVLALANAGTVRFRTKADHEVYADPKLAPTICATPDSDGILVAHEHCNQYYQCWDGNPIARHCSADLQYNPSTGICDWPNNVECGARVIPECPDEQDNADEAPTICASEGSEDLLIAHLHCDKFYKCLGRKAVVYKCSGNLLYNVAVGYCDCSSNVACGDRIVTESEEENDSNNNGNDNPSEAPAICAAENSDGVLVAHEHCNMFYKCNHGESVEFECFGDLLFNPAKGHCDWSENVDCGDRTIPEKDSVEKSKESESHEESDNGSDNGGSGACNCNPGEASSLCAKDGSDGTLIAHENCYQYYQCVHGISVAQTCPNGLLYNPYKEQCDWADNVQCGDREVPEKDSSENGGTGGGDNSSSDNGSTEDSESDNGGSGTCNCKPGEAPTLCAKDNSDGTLIAHENCNNYYICVHGQPVTQSCQNGLLYNPYEERCDWADNVECGDRIIPDNKSDETDSSGGDGGSSESDNSGTDNGGSGTCNCNPGEAPRLCALNGSDKILIAHENCNKYYICVHGQPVTQTCQNGLLYNPYEERCDWPDNVECGDRIISEVDSEETSGSDSGDSDVGSTENGDSDNGGSGTCNCNPGEAPSLCAKDGSDGTLVAHENCGKYYQCVHGVPIVQACPSGLLYNPYKEHCDWSDNVECEDRKVSEENSTENGSADNGSGGNGSSENGGGGTCNCNPGEASSLCTQDKSDGTLIAHENCGKYYQCVHGIPVAQSCPSGLLYNPYKERCEWSDNVECGDRVIPGKESSEHESTENGDNNGSSDSDSTENSEPDNGGSGTCNCNPGEAPTLCAQDGSDGILIAHENCNKYYICVHGEPVAQQCQNGLLYNPYEERCDWADGVKCEDRFVSEEDREDNSNGSSDTDSAGEDDGSENESNVEDCYDDPSQAPTVCRKDGSDGTFVAHENCNQFYVCLGGEPVVLDCPTNLLYNPNAKQCDWPENVNCGDRTLPEDSKSSENASNEESSNEGSGTCNCNPGEAPILCANEGSDGVLVAHENCDKFYQCVHGLPVVQQCQNGLLYNPHEEICDWADNVKCGDRLVSEEDCENDHNEEGSGNEEDNSGSSENDEECHDDPSQAPTICSKDESEGTYVAHENCHQFYVCIGKKPVTLDCPTNLLYNPKAKQCDWPENVYCGDRIEPNDDDKSNENNGSGTCNCNPGEASSLCANEGSDGVLVAHENCNKFYVCAHGLPEVQECHNGLLYNPYSEKCDWAENVVCGDRLVPPEEDNDDNEDSSQDGSGDNDSSENGDSNSVSNEENSHDNPSQAPVICAREDSEGKFVAHENCNQFYVCLGKEPVVLNCPNNLLYNPLIKECDWPEKVNCGDRIIPDNNEDSDDDDKSTAEETTTSKNSSEENGSIEEDSNGNDSTAEETTTSKNSSEENGSIEEDSNGNDSTAEETTTSKNSSEENGSIEEDSNGNDSTSEETTSKHSLEDDSSVQENSNSNGDGDNEYEDFVDDIKAAEYCQAKASSFEFLPHQKCNQFYACVGSEAVILSCTGDLLYNCQTKRCELAEDVDCGNRLLPDHGDNEDIEQDASNSIDEASVEKDNESADKDSTEETDNDDSEPTTTPASDTDEQVNENDGIDSEIKEYCALSNSEERVLPHENCNQYYICIGGKPVVRSCSGQFLFNPNTGLCDWPQNVKCNQGAGGAAENGASSSEEETNESLAAAICSLSGSNNRVAPHDNCANYYICVNGEPQVRKCSGQFLFNDKALLCDWPQLVDCGDRKR